MCKERCRANLMQIKEMYGLRFLSLTYFSHKWPSKLCALVTAFHCSLTQCCDQPETEAQCASSSPLGVIQWKFPLSSLLLYSLQVSWYGPFLLHHHSVYFSFSAIEASLRFFWSYTSGPLSTRLCSDHYRPGSKINCFGFKYPSALDWSCLEQLSQTRCLHFKWVFHGFQAKTPTHLTQVGTTTPFRRLKSSWTPVLQYLPLNYSYPAEAIILEGRDASQFCIYASLTFNDTCSDQPKQAAMF